MAETRPNAVLKGDPEFIPQIQRISIDLLEENTGQYSRIDEETNKQVGLGSNPRWIRDARYDALKRASPTIRNTSCTIRLKSSPFPISKATRGSISSLAAISGSRHARNSDSRKSRALYFSRTRLSRNSAPTLSSRTWSTARTTGTCLQTGNGIRTSCRTSVWN